MTKFAVFGIWLGMATVASACGNAFGSDHGSELEHAVLLEENALAATRSGERPAPTVELSQRPESSTGLLQSVVYRPPPRGRPTRRTGSASRTDSAFTADLMVLTPQDTGLTTSANPKLYWYLSELVSRAVEITVSHPDMIDPMVQIYVDGPVGPGIKEFSLEDQVESLDLGVEYEWYVALIADHDQRSGDIVTSGTIRRIETPTELQQALADAPRDQHVHILAEAGIWFDALAAISGAIARRPNDPQLRDMRASLLDQVGLPLAAEYDRSQLGQ